MSALDTGPRVLHCPACLREAEHHFDRVEYTAEGTLSWFRCKCGQMRSLDFVSVPLPSTPVDVDRWPMDLEPEPRWGD